MLLTIEKVIILKSTDIFSEISENDLLSVASQLIEVEYEKDSTILRQNELGTSMYIVALGTVDVIIDEVKVATLGKNSIFGELAALDPEPRSATVKAIEDSLVFKIDSTIIYNLISEYPGVARGIIKILCNRVRKK